MSAESARRSSTAGRARGPSAHPHWKVLADKARLLPHRSCVRNSGAEIDRFRAGLWPCKHADVFSLAAEAMKLVALRQIDIAEIGGAAEQEGRRPPGQEEFAGRAIAIDESPVRSEWIGKENGIRAVHLGGQHPLDQVHDSLPRGMSFPRQRIEGDPASHPCRFRAFQSLGQDVVADRCITGQGEETPWEAGSHPEGTRRGATQRVPAATARPPCSRLPGRCSEVVAIGNGASTRFQAMPQSRSWPMRSNSPLVRETIPAKSRQPTQPGSRSSPICQ